MEDVKIEHPVCPSSHAGIISSPVSTPPKAHHSRRPSTSPRKPKSRRRLGQKSSVSFLSEPSIDLPPLPPPHSDFDGISSPVEVPKIEFEELIKVEKVALKLEGTAKGKQKRSEGEMSDPIDCASSPAFGGREETKSPRGLKRRRDTKVALPRSKVQVIEYVGPAASGKAKGKGKAVKVENVSKSLKGKIVEEDEGLKPATQLITASWRDAFMLKPANKVRFLLSFFPLLTYPSQRTVNQTTLARRSTPSPAPLPIRSSVALSLASRTLWLIRTTNTHEEDLAISRPSLTHDEPPTARTKQFARVRHLLEIFSVGRGGRDF